MPEGTHRAMQAGETADAASQTGGTAGPWGLAHSLPSPDAQCSRRHSRSRRSAAPHKRLPACHPGFSMAVVFSTAQGGPSGGRELQTPARERRSACSLGSGSGSCSGGRRSGRRRRRWRRRGRRWWNRIWKKGPAEYWPWKALNASPYPPEGVWVVAWNQFVFELKRCDLIYNFPTELVDIRL